MGNDSFTAEGMPSPQRILFPPEMVCMEWRQRQRAGAGLHNLDNTCFLNSVLQCLTYTPPLANYLLSGEHSQACRERGFCMMCIMEAHVNKVLRSSGSAIKPLAVISVLPLTCLSCKAVSDSYEAFLDVPLDIKAASSVSAALKDFVKPEQLDGENCFKCSKCDKRVAASKRFTVHRPPKVLTLCLKRFDDFIGEKINKLVEYPAYLDLRPYMSEAAGEPLLYSLYAVVVHSGVSCGSGHYFCYAKASNGLWYEMDDMRVDPCGIERVLRQQAYLLFYVRRSDLKSGERASSAQVPSYAPSFFKQRAAGSKQ
ncbi:ubiquitin carboxyl-terminal hydrolase 42-like, partial [Grus americana]|uniref:ubiquitin carboxyl-terminal hydrolase 42-like n=1 Tax=Grus americana TaxID=9117 RepID=UPI0024083AFA